MPRDGAERRPRRPRAQQGPARRARWNNDVRGLREDQAADAAADASAVRAQIDELQPHAPPALGGANWTPLGPFGNVRGQARTLPTVSGRIRAIEVGPNGERAYAAAGDGGVWRYDRVTFGIGAGATRHDTWTPVDDFVMSPNLVNLSAGNALSTSALLVQFGANANADTLFVGTGETGHLTVAASARAPQYLGIGIRVSPGGVGARAWHLEAPHLRGQAVSRLVVDPDDPTIVWAATTAGLFVRPAGAGAGTPWTAIARGAAPNLPGNREISDVVITGSTAGPNPKIIYAAARGGAAAGPTQSAGVYSSTDNGATWNPVPLSPASAAGPGRILLAVSNTANQVVYRLDELSRLWRHDGAQFVRVTTMPPTTSILEGQGWWDMALAVEPFTDDTVYIGGATTRNDNAGPLNPAAWDAGFWRSTLTFVGPTPRFGYTSGGNPDASPLWLGAGVHSDCHAIAFARNAAGNLIPGEVWLGCDGGVFRSATGAPGTYLPVNDSLAITQPTYFDHHPTSDAIVVAGTQDNGSVRGDGGGAWRVVRVGDGGGAAIDPNNPLRIMTEVNAGTLFSLLDGAWSGITNATSPTFSGGESPPMYSRLFTSPAAPVEPDTFLIFPSNRIWVSYDWGVRWRVLPANVVPGSAVTSRLNGAADMISDVVWTAQNRFHASTRQFVFRYDRTTRNANHNTDVWTNPATRLPATGLPPARSITSLAVVNPGPPTEDLYCGLGGASTGADHVWWFNAAPPGTWMATNFGPGMTVGGVATPFDAPVNALALDPGNPRHLYVGTDVGVFRGERSAAGPPFAWDWVLWSDGLPEATVYDLKVHGPTRRLRASLHGRGIWEFDLAGGPNRSPDLYLRSNAGDSGRHLPAARNAAHPYFAGPRTVNWTMSPDIKVRRTGTAAQAPPAYPGAVLRFRTPVRDTGPNVTRWQAHVQRRGFSIGADVVGTFDVGSRQAARDMQSRYGLTAWDGFRRSIDGAIGPRSWAATTSYPALPVPMTMTGFAELIGEDVDQATDVMIADHGPNDVFLQVHNRGHLDINATRLTAILLVAASNAAGAAPQLPVDYATHIRAQDTAAAWLAASGWQFADAGVYRNNPLEINQRRPATPSWTVDFNALGFAPGDFAMLVALVSGPAPGAGESDNQLRSVERNVQTLIEGAGPAAGETKAAARLVRIDAVVAIP